MTLNTLLNQSSYGTTIENRFFKGESISIPKLEGNFLFNNCTLKNIYFAGIKGEAFIYFNNCKFISDNEKLTFQNIRVNSLNFDSCEFGNFDLEFKEVNCNLKLILKSSPKHLNISKSLIKRLLIEGQIGKSENYFSGINLDADSNFESVIIKSVNPSHMDISSVVSKEIKIDSIEVLNFVNIKLKHSRDNQIKTKLELISSEINQIIIIPNSRSNIFIKDVKMHEADFSGLKFDGGSLQVYNCKIEYLLSMTECSFNGVLFNLVNLINADINFTLSNLQGFSVLNTRWPKNYKLKNNNPANPNNPHANNNLFLRDIYRQLKEVSIRHSNKLEAQEFRRNEMEEHWNIIKGDSTFNRWDRFLIRIDKYASNFGISYTKPLALMFVFHSFLFFILLQFSNNGISHFILDPAKHDWSSFVKACSAYFYFLLPTHRTPAIWVESMSPVLIVDVFIRLSSGFFIFHFIKALRKYSN